jgi:hypothetical protein
MTRRDFHPGHRDVTPGDVITTLALLLVLFCLMALAGGQDVQSEHQQKEVPRASTR